MRRRFITADVFTDQPFGGNPLAVLPDAEGLTADQMQKLAREFNLSETVFVLPPENPAHTKLLRIFVPTSEIPFAGHPTIGAALVLAATGALDLNDLRTDIVFEMKAGPVPVTIESNDGRPSKATLTAPQKPEFRDAPPIDVVAALLSLSPDQIIKAEAASCGNPFLLVQVNSRSILGAARINMPILDRIRPDAFATEPLVFTDEAPDGFDYQARMFAPVHGIPEDPATGSAAAAFAGWLGHHDSMTDGTISRVIAQGVEMGRPSRLEIEVDKREGQVSAVRVTGSAVFISEGSIVLPALG